ncbi:MAG TPA: hypothetical protein VH682_32585 [Gemmataceae bacterium]|jgi:hypothetical protein
MNRVAPSLPEQGQLVSVRQRQWVVTEVAKSTLPASPLRPSDNCAQHLVSLSSVEDDALGEELQVIWELEPGAQVIEKVALPEPTGFDPPDRLDAFLDAVRWGAASTADVRSIQSPFRNRSSRNGASGRYLGARQAPGVARRSRVRDSTAGRVQVMVRPMTSESAGQRGVLEVIAEIRRNQQARGHVPRSREEIDAEINELRQAAEEEMQEVERLHEECQRAKREAGQGKEPGQRSSFSIPPS